LPPIGSDGSVPTWYFLNNVAGVSDRLVFDHSTSSITMYQTQHISHLQIQQLNGTGGCFHVWDPSSNYYEFGCTADSLQYRLDASGYHYYLWDLNKMVAANEGPGSVQKVMTVTYEQDKPDQGGYRSVRDSAIKQITYSEGGTTVGIVDFHYQGVYADGSWVTAYGYNYNCGGTPPQQTPLRCDDPIDYSSTVKAPAVIDTYSLLSITSYVGSSDTATTMKAYSYDFAYNSDTAFSPCTDPISQVTRYCAGEHTLKQITSTVYQNGTAHALKPVLFQYTAKYNTYSDHTQTVTGGGPYMVQTQWQYLDDYLDTQTGVGGHIVYMTAYGNTHGTPAATDGSGKVIDDRHDPTYCFKYAYNSTLTCNQGVFQYPDDRAWTTQVVTQLSTWGTDSSALSSPTTTTYAYDLRVAPTIGATSTSCPADGKGNTDCVTDYWLPIDAGNNHKDTDWAEYYHGEVHGFNNVYVLSPANDLTIQNYYTNDGWFSNSGFQGNYKAGSVALTYVYRGSVADSSDLLSQTINSFAGANGTANSCDGLLNL